MNKNVPFKNIYSNDTTNIANCTSPFHNKGEKFRPYMLRESVKEVEGKADAHFIQLAHGRVPWYQSKVYPMLEHMRWWSEHFEVPLDSLMSRDDENGYVRDGGDILQDFIDACREFGQAPFLSLRMNDEHHIEWCDKKGHTNGIHSISRFLVEHREYQFGSELEDNWSNRAMNWIYPEVRSTLLELIEEQLFGYDIDGFEMDFMRYPDLFDVANTTSEQRRTVMREFIATVRDMLTRSERNGKHRYLCLRVPSDIKMLDNLGMYPKDLEEIGVEMLNVSSSYYTDQDIDFAEFNRQFPNIAVYYEICHCTTIAPSPYASGGDSFFFRRTTPAEIYTAARLAYENGAQGMSYFNFVYYREHGSCGRGPFNEPPFEVISNVNDRGFVEKSPEHYFIAKGWTDKTQLASMLKNGMEREFVIKVCENHEKSDYRFRILTRQDIGDRRFAVTFNRMPLKRSKDLTEPYPEDNDYPPLHGNENTLMAWSVPSELVHTGENRIVVNWIGGEDIDDIRVEYMDLFPQA